MSAQDCLFCRIASGELPARFAHQDELVVAIHDVNPRAPTHILLMPRGHVESALQLSEADGEMLGHLFEVAAHLAREAGIDERGYRITSNVGPAAGQSVPHLHFHLMGGRSFGWPPG